MARRSTKVTVAAAVLLLGAGWMPSVAGGQAGPTLSVDPLRADPGDPIEVVVDGCDPSGPSPALQASVSERFDDVLDQVALAEESPGRWTATIAGNDDLRVRVVCEGNELEAEVDIERPRMFPTPVWVPMIGAPDPPDGFLGTDCPDGTTAYVFFQALGHPAPEVRTVAIDAKGDWTVGLPAFADGTTVEVSASCGSVAYPSRTYVAGGSDTLGSTSTTTSTTSSTAPGTPGTATPAPAVPAGAVTANPAYTG